MYRFLVLLLFCYGLSRPLYLIPSNITETRNINTTYKHIFFPEFAFDDVPGELFGYSIYVTPVTEQKDTLGSLDLCSTFNFLDKNFWNNSKIENPCEQYFCGEFSPIYLNMSMNSSLSLKIRQISSERHYSLQRYCTLCEKPNKEIFLPTKKCKFFRMNQYCSTESTCVYYKPELPLCYFWNDNIFYFSDDFTHKYIYWFYYSYSRIPPLIGFILSGILVLTTLIFPDVIKIVRERKRKTWKMTYFDLFSIRSWVTSTVFLLNIPISASIIFDLASITVLRVSNAVGYFCGAMVCLSFNMIIILWEHIYQKSTNLGLKYYSISTYVKIVFALLFYIIFGMIGVIFYGSYILIFEGKRTVIFYLLGVWVIVVIFCTIGYQIFLVIQSLKIFITAHKFDKFMVKVVKIFRENYMLLVLLFTFILIPTLMIGFCIFCLEVLIGKDILSVQLYIFQAPYYLYWCVLAELSMIVGLFSWDSFKYAWTCGICRKEDD